MALLRRTPREVYRVFSETDFLAAGDAGELFDPVTTEAGRRPPRQRIFAGAMLVGAVAAVSAMLITHRQLVQTQKRWLAPTVAGAAARAGSPPSVSNTASTRRRSPEPPPSVSASRRRVAAAARSGRFAASVRAAVERPREGAGSSTELERAEFSFER
jgi:hypothetical protein